MARQAIHRPNNLSGPTALTAAVIWLAAEDAMGGPDVAPEHVASARAYFAGPDYQDHLSAVGRPPDTLPAAFAEV